MKVRWNRKSVRLRITPTEMEALLHGNVVTEEILFPNGGCWSMSIQPQAEETSLTSTANQVVLKLSSSDLEHFIQPEVEGVYFGQEEDVSLRYYIEKDFPCVHPRAAEAAEPTSETFSPPADFAARKTTTA